MTRQHASGLRTARLLGVLALLLGVLAMHGLASGHHGATSRAVPLAVAHAPGSPSVGVPHARHAVLPAGSAVAAVVTGPSAEVPVDEGCAGCSDHSTAVLCLAVLNAGLVLLALLVVLRAQRPALPAPLPPLPLRRAGPPPRLRPLDLVADLCISRT